MWATHRTLIFAAWHTLPIVRRSRFGFSDEVWLYSLGTGVWRSLVARFVRDEEAVGSNPATPTVNRRDRLVPAILYVYSQTDCQHGRKGGNEAGAGGRALLRHAGGCGTQGRRQGLAGLRADAPSRRLAARTASGRATALGCREQLGRRAAALGYRKGSPALRSNDRERRPYPSAARSPMPARTQQPCP